jgi:ankyrin repeat protein
VIGVALLCTGSSAMMTIWRAAENGDMDRVEWLVRQDRGSLNARDRWNTTPVMLASREGHVGLVRWLLNEGAPVDEQLYHGLTALWLASRGGRFPVVELLLERGADPTIANNDGWTPLMAASSSGCLEVVRLLLSHPPAKASINHRDGDGRTALWLACLWGHGVVARALLESGADAAIVKDDGTTPMAVARQRSSHGVSAEGRRQCVAALEVRSFPFCLFLLSIHGNNN